MILNSLLIALVLYSIGQSYLFIFTIKSMVENKYNSNMGHVILNSIIVLSTLYVISYLIQLKGLI